MIHIAVRTREAAALCVLNPESHWVLTLGIYPRARRAAVAALSIPPHVVHRRGAWKRSSRRSGSRVQRVRRRARAKAKGWVESNGLAGEVVAGRLHGLHSACTAGPTLASADGEGARAAASRGATAAGQARRGRRSDARQGRAPTPCSRRHLVISSAGSPRRGGGRGVGCGRGDTHEGTSKSGIAQTTRPTTGVRCRQPAHLPSAAEFG